MTAPLSVLIVSENISMRMGGESSLPFYYAKLFEKRGIRVWLACHERVRDEVIEAFPSLADRSIFVADTAFQKFIFKRTSWMPYRIRDLIVGQVIHISTQWRLRGAARRLAQAKEIDVVLEPSPITPKGLSFMFSLGVPVAIGPLCGGMEFPPAFRHFDSRLTRASVRIGRWTAHIANKLVPGKLRAAVLMVANEQTREALPRGVKGKVVKIFESGVDLDIWQPVPGPETPRHEVRFVFSGRFVDLKGIQYLIPAFERAARLDASCRLDLVGGGGDYEREVMSLASNPTLEGRITLHGWVTRARAAEILREADVFVLPSLRECGGTAILEAMALGKPVIATAWGGPGEYVTPECGILVDPTGEEEFIEGLAQAILSLSRSESLRQRLGDGGKRRVREEYFEWNAKADRVLELLRECAREPRERR